MLNKIFYRCLCMFNRHADIYTTRIRIEKSEKQLVFKCRVGCGICGKEIEYTDIILLGIK